MKNFKLSSWALILSITLSSTAFADVCQKDSPNRIKMVQLKDKSWAFTYFTDQIGAPATIGPNASFTEAELTKKRALENDAVNKIGARDTGAVLGFLALLAIVGHAGPGDTPTLQNLQSPAVGPSPAELADAAKAKEELSVIEKNLITTSADCTFVPSLDKHVELLNRVLSSIYGQRFTSGKVVANKVERDLHGSKTVPAAPGESKPTSPAPESKTPAN